VNDADFSLEAFLPYRLVRLSDRLSQLLADAYRESWDLSVADWRVLSILHEHGRCMSKELSTLTHMDKARVSRAIARLEERGCLRRAPHRSDSRAFYVQLTAAGRKLVAAVIPAARHWEQALFSTLTAREQQSLFVILDKLDRAVAQADVAPLATQVRLGTAS
jgi:DNA-binding MarR family transcriptional regulator